MSDSNQLRRPSDERVALFAHLANSIPTVARPMLLAVDGVDGSGKTTFADGLAAAIAASGRVSVVVHEDDFLNPRAIRYRLGRHSPEGFVADTYDLASLESAVLAPLRPDGDRHIRRAVFDHRTDSAVRVPAEQVSEDSVVIVEGMFLHRDELADAWDLSVFLHVPFTETARRMAQRDGTSPDPNDLSMRRYVEGQRLYLARSNPQAKAAFVVDNTDPQRPRLMRSGLAGR
ncbi:AAA family ATPase [Phytoactinopolyspora limicola]|uniref:AAA family ATPase n=1 Tax=Phytoactinopolyspora limicola TaxID=2715536 RepID=UPI00140E426E|nr:uridine kinase [Phytoactinopolyspora limicola]